MTDATNRIEDLIREIHGLAAKPVNFMEVCGTHTMAIARLGIKSRLPKTVRLISGPGCPVCVTPAETIDQAIAMSRVPGVCVATFGDMMRVHGSSSSLSREKASGADIRVVYSPLDALNAAISDPNLTVVFVGIGFETTSPTIAATVIRAADLGVKNFFVLPAFKLVPPAMEILASNKGVRIDGFICPGHVSAVIGAEPYVPLAEKYRIPCVVAGFEAEDIFETIAMLLRQIAQK